MGQFAYQVPKGIEEVVIKGQCRVGNGVPEEVGKGPM